MVANRSFWAACGAASLALAGFTAWSIAQPDTPVAGASAGTAAANTDAAERPGPEHEMLTRLVGDWTSTTALEMPDDAESPASSPG